MQDALLFFIKYPSPGKVKTRLGKSIGHETAAILYKAFVEDILDSFNNAGLNILIFYDPFQSREKYEQWLGKNKFYPQQGDDLGKRMRLAFETAFSEGYARCILTGSDLPGLDPKLIKSAFETLKKSPACIGPAKDGGYYLIGFQQERFSKSIFQDIKWSTESVFPETLIKLNEKGLPTAILPQFSDIDTVDDLLQLTVNPVIETLCPRTSKQFNLCKQIHKFSI